ncbi:hypothetical protein ACH4NF_17885 [Streptomyces sp. NPDC017248]|uniref:hypothetical protein n=1 Tax=unclassified Streptomyces TaxID=2593676 RepID=UPI0037A45677
MTTAPAAAGPPDSPPDHPVPGPEPAPQALEAAAGGLLPESGPVRRLRLRPGVTVTPLLAGLHLRGRGVGVTLEGSRALPALWRLLADRFTTEPTGADPLTTETPGSDRLTMETPGADPLTTESSGSDRLTPESPGTDRLTTKSPGTDPLPVEHPVGGAGTRAEGATGDPVDPRVEAALATLTARLREHDLLVEYPDGAELPPWPGASAAHPAQAVDAIRTARPVVAAPDPRGPLAVSLVQALRRSGAAPRVTTDRRLPPDQAVVTADAPSGAVALAVSCAADGGFVTEPGPARRARRDAAAIAARLGTDDTAGAGTATDAVTGTGTTPSRTSAGAGAPRRAAAGAEGPSRTQAALLAGAAAGRLLAAVAGLPDPAGSEDASRTAAARHPAVLIARTDPPEATYHPWAGAPRAARRRPDAPPAPDLAEALRRVTELGDPRLGVLDAPLPADLPQLPASLVACRTPAGLLVAGAVRADLARLEAACRAAELALGDGSSAPVVGADPDHAHGRALRRAVLAGMNREAAQPAPKAGPAAANGVADDAWRTHPQARHWWTVLTERMGRAAELSVRRLGAEDVHAAVVRVRPAGGGAGAGHGTVSRAVEATAADAVALAALDAVTRVMAAEHVPGAARHTALSGAAAPLAAAGAEPAGWADEGWADVWLAGIAAREPALRAALRRLTGVCPPPWRDTGRSPLAEALRASAFTALTGTGGGR